MKMLIEPLANYLNRRDEWLYAVVIAAISLAQLETNSWPQYFTLIASNAAYAAPFILFKCAQQKLAGRLAKPNYLLLWLLNFIGYPLAVLLWQQNWSWHDFHVGESPGIILFSGVATEALLYISRRLNQSQLMVSVFKRIGLDELILFFLLLISIYAALLICSDLNTWYQSNSIKTVINVDEIARHPWLCLAIAVQIFALFFCGYIFYWLNRRLLIASVLKRRGLIIYLCAVLGAVVLLYPILMQLYLLLPINSMAEPIIPAVEANAFDWHNGRVFLAVVLLSFPIIQVFQWQRKSSQLDSLEKAKMQTELKLLKQQIDPHFFFNTLNNLYALCRKQSKQAPEVVLQLAELMRYVVYRGQEKFVAIAEEVDYIKDYINLQCIRLHNQLALDINCTIDDDDTLISPLLLIILVENAFKHGIEPAIASSRLTINLSVQDKQLMFSCENSLDKEQTASQDTSVITEGLGLNNLKRRLALIYPHQHTLTLQKTEEHFMAKLEINLAAAQLETWTE